MGSRCMAIRFNCPECDKPLRVPASNAGSVARCPGCRSEVAVPTPEDEVPFAEPDEEPLSVAVRRNGGLIGFGIALLCFGGLTGWAASNYHTEGKELRDRAARDPVWGQEQDRTPGSQIKMTNAQRAEIITKLNREKTETLIWNGVAVGGVGFLLCLQPWIWFLGSKGSQRESESGVGQRNPAASWEAMGALAGIGSLIVAVVALLLGK